MRDVYEYAKYFIKNGTDTNPNTYDGNMKLQKLLMLADLANIAEHGVPLFEEPVLAFKNGCVVEKIRLRYRNDYASFKRDSDSFDPDFSEQEYEILNLVINIFGKVSARELSKINHTFEFWKIAYAAGTREDGFHDKKRSVVDMMSQENDIARMRDVIRSYREASRVAMAHDVINGVTFYYDGFEMSDEVIEQLEGFSLEAEDDSYSVYMDNGELVIY